MLRHLRAIVGLIFVRCELCRMAVLVGKLGMLSALSREIISRSIKMLFQPHVIG